MKIWDGMSIDMYSVLLKEVPKEDIKYGYGFRRSAKYKKDFIMSLNNNSYSLMLGQFNTEEEAEEFVSEIIKNEGNMLMVVDLDNYKLLHNFGVIEEEFYK